MRTHVSSGVTVRGGQGSAGITHRISSLSVATIAVTVLALHAVDAWVLQVRGETGPARRTTLFLCVLAAATLVRVGAELFSERWRAAGMLAIGLVGLTVVGPITVMHVVKQGVGGSTFTGIPALAALAVLVSVGTARFVRSFERGWRRRLAVPVVALVVIQFVLFPLALAVYITNAPRPELGARTPADYGLGFEDVTFAAADGTLLSAWYVPTRNGAAVLLRHGSGSTRSNTLRHAAFLADAGFGVLLTDARGHGLSDGRINEYGWHGESDIVGALDYLGSRSEIDRGIGVLGLSMGGEEAITAAAADPRIAAVVSEGAGTGRYADAVGGGEHAIARIVDRTMFSAVDLLSDATEPIGLEEAMKVISERPVLLISGSVAQEREANRRYAAAGGSATALWELSDTPHTDGLFVHRDEYVRRVVGLFESSLLH